MPDPASIKLSNGAVVKVGDCLRLKNGQLTLPIKIEPRRNGTCLSDGVLWWDYLGRWTSVGHSNLDIDLAALATPGAPAVPAERVLGLAALEIRWRARAKMHATEVGFFAAGQASAFNDCAIELAAALEALVPSKESSGGC